MSKFAEIKDLSIKLKDSRYIVVGDIHGCLDELELLLDKMDFGTQDVLIHVGDLCDRGLRSFDLIEFCRKLEAEGRFYSVKGNHDDRFIRYLKGNNVKIKHGLQITIDDIYANYHKSCYNYDLYKENLLYFFKGFPRIIKLPNDVYVVHAGFNPDNPPDQQTKEDCIYMRYYGGQDYFDNVNGKYWFQSLPKDYPGRILFGHEYIDCYYPLGNKQVIALDGGCVFGQELRGWDSHTDQVSSVPALKTYFSSNATKEELLENSKKHYSENK